ncbi:hypothetical protein GRX66_04860, partial [Halobacterium sp. PCN9]|nr:hypothetical protein [Halobacterium bonnevillei]
MRVRFGGVERCGRAIDLRDVDVTADAVLRAVRDPDDGRVVAPPPRTGGGGGFAAGPRLHDRVGFAASRRHRFDRPGGRCGGPLAVCETEYD